MGDGPSKTTSLSGAAALITTARSVQMVIVLLLSLALVRVLTELEYGTYLHVTFLASVLPLVVSVWAGKAVIFFFPRTDAPARLLRGIAAVLALMGGAVALAIALVPGVLAAFDPGDARLVEHRVIIGLTLGAAFPYTIAEPVMLTRGARRGYAGVLIAVSFALLFGVGGALAYAPEEERLYWCLWALCVAHVVQGAAALLWLVLSPGEPGPDTKPTPWRTIAAFAIPVAGAALVSLLAVRIDGLLVPRLYSEAAKNFYFRGAMDIPVIGAIAFTLLSLIAPEISRLHAVGDREPLLYLWRRTCRVAGLVSIPVVCAVQAVAPDLFTIFYPGYEASVPVFRWYTALILVRVFLPQVLMENTGAAKKTVIVAVTNLVLAVVLCLVLMPRFGWVGAAPAMVFATLLANWVVGGELARRQLSASWSELVDWDGLARLSAASLLAFGAGYLLLELPALADIGRIPRVLVGCAAFGAVFLIAAKLLRALHADDVAALRKALPGWLGGRD